MSASARFADTVAAIIRARGYRVRPHIPTPYPASNYSNVHGDIQRLLALGLVEKNAAGQVLVPFDDIVVQVDASLMAAA